MLSCKHCQTPNSLDSTFCKRCGAPVAEADIVEAQAKMEKLVEEGNALFNAGRTDEALAIAEAATLANPSSTSAWSLKTLCHERRGEIAEALECADRLVELNPDSDFDRIRRATLRQKLQTDLHVPAGPDRRLAMVAAASAVVLVLCAGAIVAKLNSGSTASRTPMSQTTPLVQNTVTNPAPQPTYQAPVQSQTPADPGNTSQATPAPRQQDPAPQERYPTPRASEAPVRLPSAPSGEILPRPDDGSGQVTIRPLEPNVSGLDLSGPSTSGPKTPTKATSTSDSKNDPQPIAVPPTDNATTKPAEDSGVIEISVRKSAGSRGTTGGAEPISGNGLEALVRVGSQQYQLGNYAAAAKSYEQAVRNGGDGIILNRRLAQAYERLGRSGEAADAYRRCIAAIDSSIAAGRGNKTNLSSTRDLCEQALKVLQGG